MSIVRIGMSEDDKFGNGYDAIFGSKDATAKKPDAKPADKKPADKKPDDKKKTTDKKK